MKLYNAILEAQALVSILASPLDVRSTLLLQVTPTHFGFGPSREVFTRIQNVLRTASPDQLPSLEVFLQDPVLSDEAKVSLHTTAIPVQAKADAEALYSMLESFRQARTLHSGTVTLTDHLKGGHDELPQAVHTMEQTLLTIRSSNESLELFHAGVNDTLEPEVISVIEKPQAVFVPSGIATFDSRAGGFERGDLVILASHVSGGKTWLMINIAIQQYLSHCLDTCLVSLEMSKEEMIGRALANISGVSHTLIRNGNMHPMYKRDCLVSYQDFTKHGVDRNCRFTLHPSSRLTPSSLEAMVKPLGYDCILIDYLNMMQHEEESLPMWQKLGEIVRDLKLLAKRLNAVIVLATQMGEGELIRYSRMVKEHADFVWMWVCGDEEKAAGQVTINQDKARNIEQFPFLCGINFDAGIFGQPPVVAEDLKWSLTGDPSPPPGMDI